MIRCWNFLDFDMTKNKDIKLVVEHTSKLACLNFSEEELKSLASKFQAVLSYVGELDKLDVKNVTSMSHAVEMSGGRLSLREDEVVEFNSIDEILKSAPSLDGAFIQVPKVIDSE